MAQVKIYGFKEHLLPIRERLSDMIHRCSQESPAEKLGLSRHARRRDSAEL